MGRHCEGFRLRPAVGQVSAAASLEGNFIVKIDGAFVQNIARSADDRAFVQALIGRARRPQIKTVVEWVQDEEAAATEVVLPAASQA